MDEKGYEIARGALLSIIAAMWRRKDTKGVVEVWKALQIFQEMVVLFLEVNSIKEQKKRALKIHWF